MVLITTFNNISAIWQWSVLSVDETRVPVENHKKNTKIQKKTQNKTNRKQNKKRNKIKLNKTKHEIK